jgi:hypothetical protein
MSTDWSKYKKSQDIRIAQFLKENPEPPMTWGHICWGIMWYACFFAILIALNIWTAR